MKKGISLLLVLMLVFGLFTTVAFAEAPADKGFYNISMETGTTITPYNIAGGTVTEEEGLFKGSDAFTVEYTGAVSGKYYMVWLVQGTAIDLTNNNVYYVDQQTASSSTVSFEVIPTTWQTDGKKMAEDTEYTVMISTDATGEGAFRVGSVYYGGAASYIKGDVNGSGEFDDDDAIHLLFYYMFGEEDYPVNQPCDFDGSGEVDDDDAIYLLFNYMFGDEDYPLY